MHRKIFLSIYLCKSFKVPFLTSCCMCLIIFYVQTKFSRSVFLLKCNIILFSLPSVKTKKENNQSPQFVSGVIMKITDSKPLPARKILKVLNPFMASFYYLKLQFVTKI